MSSTTEQEFIEKCKFLIESQLEWKNHKEWKNRDFEYLSELIYSKTKTSISVSTLKRIWKNDRTGTPHVSTLDALARYVGFGNWNILKSELKDRNIITNVPVQRLKYHISLKPLIITSIIIMISVIVIWASRKSILKNQDSVVISEASIQFSSKKTITTGLPNSVVFQYDISKVKSDSAFIQQDWDKTRRTKISPDQHYHTSIYYYPGFYNAKLVINDQIVKEHPLFITTDGWMAVYKKTYKQEIPLYLNEINLYKKEGLHVSVEDLRNHKIDNDKDYYIGFYNARDYSSVTCDSFSFETEIKNDPAEGGLTCQYAVITIEGEKGIITTSFSEKGCTSNLFLYIGDKYFDGKQNDLSAFGTSMNEWHKIHYEVMNKSVRILLDGKEIHQSVFTNNPGRIINIWYEFYGCGTVGATRLWNKVHQLVYEEKFR